MKEDIFHEILKSILFGSGDGRWQGTRILDLYKQQEQRDEAGKETSKIKTLWREKNIKLKTLLITSL